MCTKVQAVSCTRSLEMGRLVSVQIIMQSIGSSLRKGKVKKERCCPNIGNLGNKSVRLKCGNPAQTTREVVGHIYIYNNTKV